MQDAYFIQEKARKIRKMLLCKMRYNRPFNLIDKQNIERYSITFEEKKLEEDNLSRLKVTFPNISLQRNWPRWT